MGRGERLTQKRICIALGYREVKVWEGGYEMEGVKGKKKQNTHKRRGHP